MRLLLTAASTLLFLVSTAFGFVDFVPTLAGRHHRSIRTHICPHWLVLQKGNKENFTEGNEANEGFQRFAMPLGPNPQSFVAFCKICLCFTSVGWSRGRYAFTAMALTQAWANKLHGDVAHLRRAMADSPSLACSSWSARYSAITRGSG